MRRLLFSAFSTFLFLSCLEPKSSKKKHEISYDKCEFSKWLDQGRSYEFGSLSSKSIKILVTAALIDHFFDERKQEYLRSLNLLKKMNVEVVVVENCKKESFFDLFFPVCYSQSNNLSFKNKGINEALAMLAALDYFGFDDDDMIVKVTGRYAFENENLLNHIEHCSSYDAYARLSNVHTSKLREIDFFTGCFAIRCKYLKMFLKELDLVYMEKEQIPIEWELGKFFRRHPEIKVHKLKKIYLYANVFGTGYNGPRKRY